MLFVTPLQSTLSHTLTLTKSIYLQKQFRKSIFSIDDSMLR